ncbi:chromate transporter [Marivirga tractuosa]|uniref:Chromate transporter, chromate ion transporter (CHR) family n=1 Tax=Marivirga tractuosa (strain ATCC 23168 / DSM 4126 / NBRC 15989 / NCIMB 1408 / VKM B-1430 / H-43) TaxID=643867 RepID=E4TRN6_MARTH|nr:chromate efflux transporter [Marivirga tractuosa]ADR21757.1 chromate transporter, chromate ion transporter (CHR) family [Marivirga tractuosa DSM 4126]BDD13785.1 chromate transporter [Marivirga tractuosa]
MVRNIRYLIYLKDILILSLTTFGGATAHFAYFLDHLVYKRGYLTEKELIEMNALCQMLPGPSSTQILTGLAVKIGGAPFAFLTLFVWAIPGVALMTGFGILMSNIDEKELSTHFLTFVQPIAVGFVAAAAYRIVKKVIHTKTSVILLVISAAISVWINSPYLFPALILAGGFITAFKYKSQPIEEKEKIKIRWTALIIWISALILIALIGLYTQSLPIRLLENFYRNGSLIFGGGQVLIPFLYTEFVDFKDYLSSSEFLSGFAIAQAIPGPTFSFASYIGALSMREYGVWGEILGGFLAAVGIFVPGTLMMIFLIRFWDQLKKFRIIKASLEGITAVSSGMVVAAIFLLFEPVQANLLNFSLIIGTLAILLFTKIPAPYVVLIGLLAGFLLG